MPSPFEQRPAQIPTLQPQRHRPKATISTWITAAVVLVFMVFGIRAGGFGGALVILAISLFVTGLYAFLTGRPSWLRLPTRRVGGATSGAAVAILIIGAMLLPPAEDGNEIATGRTQTVQVTSTPTKTSQATTSPAEASARASASASAEAEAEASAAAAQETAAAAKVAAEAEAKVKAEAEAAAKAEAEAEAKAKADADAKAAAAKAAEEAGTFSQQNALKTAKNYLTFMAFSYPGLISQLEYEQYSTEDATWAVDRMNVDWNLQAAKSAKNYLESMAFSRAGLVDQLIYEGFTPEQAEYGVSQTGL